MKIDAHQHFWAYVPAEYPWIGPGLDRLARDYLPGDLKPLLEAAGFDSCVAVQARQSVEETRWLLELADRHPLIRGVVGWVDLLQAGVAELLRVFADHPRFVGVRHVVPNEPDREFVLGPEFQRGLRALHDFGLTYDLLIVPGQLPAAATLAGLTPEQPYVLDHLGKPLIKDRSLDPWRTEFEALARHHNVSCKLSGMVTEAAHGSWQREDFHPYLEIALEAFGPARLMIGSDWPVCLLAADYADTIGIVIDFIAGLAAAEQAAIMGGTAQRIYGLDT